MADTSIYKARISDDFSLPCITMVIQIEGRQLHALYYNGHLDRRETTPTCPVLQWSFRQKGDNFCMPCITMIGHLDRRETTPTCPVLQWSFRQKGDNYCIPCITMVIQIEGRELLHTLYYNGHLDRRETTPACPVLQWSFRQKGDNSCIPSSVTKARKQKRGYKVYIKCVINSNICILMNLHLVDTSLHNTHSNRERSFVLSIYYRYNTFNIVIVLCMSNFLILLPVSTQIVLLVIYQKMYSAPVM